MSNLIERSDALDKKLEQHPDLNKNVEELMAYGRRNRRLIKLLYASIIFEAVLLVGLIYFANQSITNRNRTESTHISVVASCKAGNDFREDNLILWKHLLAITPAVPRTAEQEKNVADFRNFVFKTFELRDCSKIQ